MSKQSGLGWTTLTVDSSASSPEVIKNDVTNLDISTPRAVQDVTGVDKSAIERILLLADMTVNLHGVFNPVASPSSHDVFKTVPSTSVARNVALTVGGVNLNAKLLPTDYKLTRAASGELTWDVPMVLADGTVPTWT